MLVQHNICANILWVFCSYSRIICYSFLHTQLGWHRCRSLGQIKLRTTKIFSSFSNSISWYSRITTKYSFNGNYDNEVGKLFASYFLSIQNYHLSKILFNEMPQKSLVDLISSMKNLYWRHATKSTVKSTLFYFLHTNHTVKRNPTFLSVLKRCYENSGTSSRQMFGKYKKFSPSLSISFTIDFIELYNPILYSSTIWAYQIWPNIYWFD